MACLDDARREQLAVFCNQEEIVLRWNEPMREHTSFKIGGPAWAMAIPQNREQLSALLRFVEKEKVPVWFVGNGSNLLVSDDGLDGLVILLDGAFDGEIQVEGNILQSPAGKKLSAVCAAACAASLSGMEFAWGIPGSVGGAVYMNAGAYGGEIKDRLLWVEYLDRQGGGRRAAAKELELSYRHSCFMRPEYAGVCIVRAAFLLEPGEKEQIQRQMDDILSRRKEKQPLEYPSAGSTFKRPQGAYAAQLIDECSLRGFTVGGAQVSTKHAGFVINTGNATCQDVLELTRQVREKVKTEKGYELQLEVRLLP